MRPDEAEEPKVKTRASKALGAAAGIAAIVASLPLAINAYADPAPEPTPVAPIPDPQGPGCDAFKTALPNWKGLADQQIGTALASIPNISTFNSSISGQANPAVNIVPVLDNGPYVVFAPTNEAFAAMEPGQLDAHQGRSGGAERSSTTTTCSSACSAPTTCTVSGPPSRAPRSR